MIDPCSEYPKAAYKLGGDVEIWGRMMHFRALVDSQDEAGALADGWALHPNDLLEEDETEDAPKRRGRPPKVTE